MRAALIINEVTADTDANLSSILDWVRQAAEAKVHLVLFPEAALTGIINNNDPSHDLPLGQEIPGPVTEVLSAAAREHRVYVAIGLLERDGDKLYDSAILLEPDGKIILKYRRIQPQWLAPGADPFVYCRGTELSKVETSLGSFAFMICGDLFDDELVRKVSNLRPDWLLLPFARCFNDLSCDQERWDGEEEPQYVSRVKLAGTTTLMTNYLAGFDPNGDAFGGAMVVSKEGVVTARYPLGKPGMMLADIPRIGVGCAL